MQTLWAPWRMEYIKRERGASERCVFCNLAIRTENDADNHVLARAQHCYAVLNRYPYSNGHLMIVPNVHVASPEKLGERDLAEMTLMTNRALRVLREVCKPSAFNTGANIGADAGAGIADHYHFHIVPRWAGDVNFMTSVCGTRVIPESLDGLFGEMKAVWDSLFGESSSRER